MKPLLAMLLFLAPALAAEEPSEAITDKDMLAATSSVEEANLENILYSADKEAKRSLEHVQALLAAARAAASGLESELADPGDEDFKTSSDLLEAKAQQVEEKAGAASVVLPKLSRDALLSRRGSYRAKDREVDLKRLELAYSKLRGRYPKADLEPAQAQKELLASIRAFREELDHFRSLAKDAVTSPERTFQLEAQGADLVREVHITETAWRLKRLDAAAFTAAPRKKKR